MLRAFAPDRATITQSGIRADKGEWRIDTTEKQTIRLFEVESPAVEQCLLTYRAELKTEGLKGRAFLEMWCRLPGRGEFFSKGHHQAVTGTASWARYEIPFYLKTGQKPRPHQAQPCGRRSGHGVAQKHRAAEDAPRVVR